MKKIKCERWLLKIIRKNLQEMIRIIDEKEIKKDDGLDYLRKAYQEELKRSGRERREGG